jgi:hypothetical protein
MIANRSCCVRRRVAAYRRAKADRFASWKQFLSRNSSSFASGFDHCAAKLNKAGAVRNQDCQAFGSYRRGDLVHLSHALESRRDANT